MGSPRAFLPSGNYVPQWSIVPNRQIPSRGLGFVPKTFMQCVGLSNNRRFAVRFRSSMTWLGQPGAIACRRSLLASRTGFRHFAPRSRSAQ